MRRVTIFLRYTYSSIDVGPSPHEMSQYISMVASGCQVNTELTCKHTRHHPLVINDLQLCCARARHYVVYHVTSPSHSKVHAKSFLSQPASQHPIIITE
jgi:hypothetical protein